MITLTQEFQSIMLQQTAQPRRGSALGERWLWAFDGAISMCHKIKTVLFSSSIIILILLGMEVASADSGTETLDSFYAAELNKFNEAFESHIEQLDKCLSEMERFEKGEVFLEPTECAKFDESRPYAASLLEEVEIVMKSYAKWLDAIVDDNAIKNSSAASNMTNALLQIYSTKFQKALIQTMRVRKQEEQLVNEINKLGETLRQLNSPEETEPVEKPSEPIQ